MDLLALGIALHWWATKEERAERKARRKALEDAKRKAEGLPPKKPIFKTHSKLKIFLICVGLLYILSQLDIYFNLL